MLGLPAGGVERLADAGVVATLLSVFLFCCASANKQTVIHSTPIKYLLFIFCLVFCFNKLKVMIFPQRFKRLFYTIVCKGFGSCHSFDVVVGLRGYGMCQMRGQVEAQSSLKSEGSAVLFLSLSLFLIFQSPSFLEAFHLYIGNLW
jgi:hypothetical protein